MATYKAPLRDMQFVMQDLINFEKHYQSLPACDEVNQELIDAILGEASKFAEEIVAPLNAVGDEVGCTMLEDGEVRTPPGFKEAYEQYIEGGWPSLDQPARYGGQDLPMSIGLPVREMNGRPTGPGPCTQAFPMAQWRPLTNTVPTNRRPCSWNRW